MYGPFFACCFWDKLNSKDKINTVAIMDRWYLGVGGWSKTRYSVCISHYKVILGHCCNGILQD